jgi:hypothetical protein
MATEGEPTTVPQPTVAPVRIDWDAFRTGMEGHIDLVRAFETIYPRYVYDGPMGEQGPGRTAYEASSYQVAVDFLRTTMALQPIRSRQVAGLALSLARMELTA